MKRLLSLSLFALMFLGLLQAVALADGMILPDHPERGWLTVTYHHVSVSVEDGVVITRVDQEFPARCCGLRFLDVGQWREARRQDPWSG